MKDSSLAKLMGKQGRPESGLQPLFHVVIVPVQELEADMGVLLLKPLQHGGEPVDGYGGEGADADGAGGQAVDGGHGLLQPHLGGEDGPHRGQDPLALLRESDPRSAPLQQGEAEPLLQGGEGVAHGGLGEAQVPGGPAHAPGLQGAEEDLIFLNAHIRLV